MRNSNGRDSSQSHSHIVNQIAHKAHRPFGVMDIARPILHPQDVSGLSQMSQDRIIGGIFTMMRIKSPKSPRNPGPRSNHAAVNIQGQSPELLLLNGLTYHLTVEFHQSLKRLVPKPLQPTGHATLPGQTQQTTKPLHQRIFTKIVQMIERVGHQPISKPRSPGSYRWPGSLRLCHIRVNTACTRR